MDMAKCMRTMKQHFTPNSIFNQGYCVWSLNLRALYRVSSILFLYSTGEHRCIPGGVQRMNEPQTRLTTVYRST